MEIRGSVVLITGAATRVGRATALSLAAKGANIAFSYYLEDEPWRETKTEIERCGVRALAVQTEVRDAAQVRKLVDETVREFGQLDVLINNASVWLKEPFLEISEEAWDLEIDVNLKGPFLASQAAARRMLAQGRGLIVNITDLSAFQVWPGNAHHAAAKAGLAMLTKYMAMELAPAVRVNAIAPGTILLPEHATPEKVAWSTEKSVLKRIGTPEEFAELVQFLIASDFVTGSVYFIDGGRSLV